MAKDGVIVDINTKAFEAALYRMYRKDAESVLYKAVSAGGRIAKNELKSITPESKEGSSGWRLASRNHPQGTLRDSVKFSLRKRARARNAFFGALYYQEDNKSKYYAKFVINTHSPNAFGYRGGNDIVKKSIQKSKDKVVSRIEKNLINRFTKYYQQYL